MNESRFARRNVQPEDRLLAVAIIPARYNSTRLPGKPLLLINNRPMILHTIERALAARTVARVIVATDDERVRAAVDAAGYEAVMTGSEHNSGTDRLAEVAANLNDAEIIVNVQGDEPLIAPETIDQAVEALTTHADVQMATTSEPVASIDEVLSPDVVKVVTDEKGRALYFSRSPIPFPRDLVRRYGSLPAALNHEPSALQMFRKHTGLYAYRHGFLLEYTGWQQSPLEQLESLEQLRALAHGARIQVVEAAAPSISVDTAEDLERVRTVLQGVTLCRKN